MSVNYFIALGQQKKISVALVLVSVLILLMPNFLVGETDEIALYEQIGLALIFWLTWFAIFKRIWLALAVASFVFWLTPISLYLRYIYGVPINTVFVGMALDTNLHEFMDFIVTYGVYFLPAIVILGIFNTLTIYSSYRSNLQWKHRSRLWILMLAPLYLIALLIQSILLKPFYYLDEVHPLDIPDQTLWTEKVKSVYPLEIFFSLFDYASGQKKMHSLKSALKDYKFHASLGTNSAPDIVVLVIGESARADRWHLFGYDKPTTPELEKEKGVIGFSDVITQSTATRYAVPSLVSRHPLFNADGKVNKFVQPSFLKIFSEVGYRTYWLSNQSGSGFYDSPIDFYAQDADVVRYTNVSSYSFAGNYDEVLLRPFSEYLAENNKSLFIVHLLGSHFNYSHRYPHAYEKFKPSMTGSLFAKIHDKQKMNSSAKQLVNNSYDNSILYTDFILSQIISRIKKTGKAAVVAYVSDHAEDIYESGCANVAIGRISAVSYHVPAFIWMSDQQIDAHPQLYELLKSKENSALESAIFSNSLVEIAGIKTDGNVENLASTPRHGPRMVYGQSNWIDYDKAKLKDRCKIN